MGSCIYGFAEKLYRGIERYLCQTFSNPFQHPKDASRKASIKSDEKLRDILRMLLIEDSFDRMDGGADMKAESFREYLQIFVAHRMEQLWLII